MTCLELGSYFSGHLEFYFDCLSCSSDVYVKHDMIQVLCKEIPLHKISTWPTIDLNKPLAHC